MNKTTKGFFAVILALAVCFHFVMVFVHCFPNKIQNQKLNFVNNLYVYPLFHQNWNLFVPAPNVERKLFVRFKTKESFSDWEDILSKEILDHRGNRLLGNEARVLLLSNSLIYELNSLDSKESFLFKSKPSNTEFKVLQFEIEKYLKLENNLISPIDYELLLVSTSNVKTKAYYIQSLTIN
jgi:hypothetical protein